MKRVMITGIVKPIAMLFFTFSLVFSLAAVRAIAAGTTTDKKLNSDIESIDKAGSGDGGSVVVQKIEKEFSVTDTQISALRDQKLGYGEITTVFALAQKMGGITDANISTIMSLRQGPPVMGWGEIARKLDLKLGSVESSVHAVRAGSDKTGTEHESSMASDKRGGMDRMDRMDRTDRGSMGHGR